MERPVGQHCDFSVFWLDKELHFEEVCEDQTTRCNRAVAGGTLRLLAGR